MNSAAQASDVPEQAISFDEFFRNENGGNEGPYSLGNQFFNKLFGFVDSSKSRYETYLNNLNIRNEQKAVQSARAWDEYMSNTAYSRAFEDLKRAGVNPYILLNSGSSPSTSVGSSSKPNYQVSKPGTRDSESNVKGRDIALTVLAIAKIIALMA